MRRQDKNDDAKAATTTDLLKIRYGCEKRMYEASRHQGRLFAWQPGRADEGLGTGRELQQGRPAVLHLRRHGIWHGTNQLKRRCGRVEPRAGPRLRTEETLTGMLSWKPWSSVDLDVQA